MYWIMISCLGSGLIGLYFMIYFMKKGQFEDLEEIKYEMFHEDNDQLDEKK